MCVCVCVRASAVNMSACVCLKVGGGACVLRVSSDRDERASQLKPFRASFFLPGGIRRGEGGGMYV